MARPLIVKPGTERLQVVLMRGCATVDVAEVMLTITRKGEAPCLPAPPCADACGRSWPRAHDVPGGCWGGCDRCGESNCSECGAQATTSVHCRPCGGAPPALPLPPSKTYRAETVARGIATFAIDQDLCEAPAGWYLGRVVVAGCEVAVLTIWVRCATKVGRACSV